MKNSNFTVNEEDRGKRLDVFLTEKIDCTRSEIKKKIVHNLVLLNSEFPKKAGQALRVGDKISISDEKPDIGVDFTKKIKIIKDINDYVIVDKPSGLLVHPTGRGEINTLAQWIIDNYPNVVGVGDLSSRTSGSRQGKMLERPGIVHRLDKEASGVMVVAKNQEMFEHLKKQFKDRSVEKEYSVLVHGTPQNNHDEIDFEISRGVDGKMAARPKIDNLKVKNVGKEQLGRGALTEFWVEKKFARFSLLKVKIHTGRTHQIRVHMLAYGHPVVGDNLHFNKKLNRKRDEKLGRVFLHAKGLCFDDLQNNKVCYNSPLPKELLDFINEIS
ncbi:MAG: RluA family pseudouridine synthase [bacterium]|nr:RluA family pseudouridine synthase [bacterium]